MKNKEIKPRYSICTITTTDLEFAQELKKLNNAGYSYEFILRNGVDKINELRKNG